MKWLEVMQDRSNSEIRFNILLLLLLLLLLLSNLSNGYQRLYPWG